MCVASNVGDFFGKKWEPWVRPYNPYAPGWPNVMPTNPPPDEDNEIKFPSNFKIVTPVSREEFDKLKKEVEEMKDLMQKAIEIDKKTGQPNCEMEEKLAILRAVAKAVGVNLDDILPPKMNA